MNKTIKIIDLLNRIANGEVVPKIIRYKNYDFEYHERLDDVYNYKVIGSGSKYLNDVFFIDNILNDEIEIIEDNDKLENKKMFKLNKFVPSQEYIMTDKNVDLDNKIEMIRKRFYSNELYMLDIVNTINELIDHINKIEEKLDER